MKIFIIEEKLANADLEDIKKMKEDPESTWAMKKEALKKDLKRQAAGLVNRVHIESFRRGLK